MTASAATVKKAGVGAAAGLDLAEDLGRDVGRAGDVHDAALAARLSRQAA